MKKSKLLLIICLFAVFNCSAQLTKLLDLNDTTGRFPQGALFFDGTYLYATTPTGGLHTSGTAVKIKPDGAGYVKLLDFNDSIGHATTTGAFISDGTFLYGTTSLGGTFGFGTLFKMKPDGTEYTILYSFINSLTGLGGGASLVSDGIFFYGLGSGGTSGLGTFFKIKPDGTGYAKLLDFNGASNGSHPYGSLIFDGTFMYGMTSAGGISDFGTVFKIKPDGTLFQKLLDFNGFVNGRNPFGDLLFDGTFLYGLTSSGGTNSLGTLFKIKSDGTMYTKLLDFNGTSNGAYPYASLITDGTFLYGVTEGGGISNSGTIFKIKPNGTAYSKLYEFDGVIGYEPFGSIISEGTFLYGMTVAGGTSTFCGAGCGTIYKFAYSPSCIANYTTTYDSTLNTFNLNVDSATTAMAVSYHWDFGDGTTSTLATPSHIYSVDTVYNVCMKVYTAAGDSCTYCHIIGKNYLGNIIRNAGFTINIHNTNITAGVSQNIVNEKIKIFPNPSNGIFNLSISEPIKNTSIEVYNSIGALVYKKNILSRENTIELSEQAKGLYFVKVVSEDRIIGVGKIVKE